MSTEIQKQIDDAITANNLAQELKTSREIIETCQNFYRGVVSDLHSRCTTVCENAMQQAIRSNTQSATAEQQAVADRALAAFRAEAEKFRAENTGAEFERVIKGVVLRTLAERKVISGLDNLPVRV